MKTTPLISIEMQAVPHAGKYSLCDNRGLALGEAIGLLDGARAIIKDYKQTLGFGEVCKQCRGLLTAIEAFAAVHRDNCLDKATPRPWWIAYGQAYAGNGIDLQIAVLKADRDEPRTTPTERDANLELAVRAVNSYDVLRAVAEAVEAMEGRYTLTPTLEKALANLAALDKEQGK